MAKKTKGKSRAKRLAVKTAKRVPQMRPARAKAPGHESRSSSGSRGLYRRTRRAARGDEITIVRGEHPREGSRAFSMETALT